MFQLLENIIEDLYEKQNIGCGLEQKSLYTKKQYYELLYPVIEIVKNNKDATIDEMREILYVQSGIEEKVKDFIYNKEAVPGMVFSYGTESFRETIVIGNSEEVQLAENGKLTPCVKKMTEDTIFDLASVTKVFTSISILKLVQDGTVKLDDEIIKYSSEFRNLKGVTIFDLLSFGVPLKTSGRVDKALSREEAERILFDIEIDAENNNKRPYTDMGAMVLKYVVEKVSGMDYYAFVYENILKGMQMKDTHVNIPKDKLNRVASTNYDGKYYKDGNFSITTAANKGIVYDPKAQIMGQEQGNLSGHAGLFSTVDDMTSLAKGIINGQIIDEQYVEMMAKNRTGKKYIEEEKEKYIQYLGFLCYSKNPNLKESELNPAMSGKSFASAGWTGTQLTVDPLNNIYFFMAANRSHNRMIFIDLSHKDKGIINQRGRKSIILPNGQEMIDATRFAYDKHTIAVEPALQLAIQYKALEDIVNYNKEIDGVKEKVKQL